ncbi:hypothetical protein [Aliidiomarina maris]|uniref:DUF1570 domain-containing protein n=1 Tax=Aliidiomarina maris TaxID=531312 RepID=A0A327WW45_9GAMM|nr:hypothetical protein [Aliidiomarina maris]RAJ97077.1 hypothetical protein B0I24_106140 [Aliidiomarina maris]RUO24678.1 hypothetical protein CWE07_08405 [Aliidiomarina maris]
MLFRIIIILITVTLSFAGVSASASERLTVRELDQKIVKELRAEGDCINTTNVVLCAQQGKFEPDTLASLLELFDEGAIAIRQYLGSQFDMPGNEDDPIEFFVHSDVGVPHTTIFHEPWIFLNIDTITYDMIPYLHEMVHVMAQWSWRTSEWVGEGFANYVASSVVESGVGYHRSFILADGLERLSEFCGSSAGAAMLPLVGEPGRRSTLSDENAAIFRLMMSDRRTYAPAYYAMSWSFTEYLIENIGLDGLRAIAESMDPSSVSKTISDTTIEEHKDKWREQYCDV